MTVPFAPSGNQVLEVKPDETAFMSVASMDRDIPLGNWQTLGWVVGNSIGESDMIPKDCASMPERQSRTSYMLFAPAQAR